MKKKIQKEISEYFKKLGEKSWIVRKKKILESQKTKGRKK